MKVIEFNNVWKKFRRGEKLNSLRDFIPSLFHKALNLNNGNGLKQEEFWALRDVSFNVERGEVLGIIGSNGAGKSTVLKLLSGIIIPNKGEIKLQGRLSALIEVTAGFHPELTGRENVYLNGTILGMKKKEIDAKFDEIIDFSGIKEFIDTPVKRYSSGMFSRLGFSVAAHMDPDILLVDEVLSVGDIAFQAKCAQKMRQLLNSGVTIVLVSHNLSLIQGLCKKVILFDKGMMLKEGIAAEVIPYYENVVYTQREEELKKEITASDYKVRLSNETPVRITNVSLSNGGLKQKESFSTGESISVRLEVEAKGEIEDPIFLLEIIRSDGLLCCASNSKDSKFHLGKLNGKTAITIDLGNLNLTPGIYILKLSLWDKEMIHPYVIRKNDILKISSSVVGNNFGGVFLQPIVWRQWQEKHNGMHTEKDGVIIEKARQEDKAAIFELLKQANMHYIPSQEIPELTYENYYVAKVEGKVVGFCGYKILSPAEAKTELMVVDKLYRGRGIGFLLQLKRMEEICAKGIRVLTTNTDLPETIRWYKENFDYKEIGKLKKYHEFGCASIDYWTTLQVDLAMWETARKGVMK